MTHDPQPDSSASTQSARFSGIARLYGTDGLKRFREAHIAVVGIGGVGSWVAEGLARSGIGTITLMDLDDICLTNINRQIHALEDTIGQSKIRAMAHRLRSINPDMEVHELHSFYGESTSEAFFNNAFSVVVDAIDSVRQKAHLLATAREYKVPVVTIGGAGGRIDPTRIKAADLSRSEGDRLLMLVRKKLRTAYRFPRLGKGKFKIPCIYSDEPPRFAKPDGSICQTRADADFASGINCDTGLGSATHVTASMAFFATAEVLGRLLTNSSPLRGQRLG